MSFAPISLLQDRLYLHEHAGIALASIGIVGDTAHNVAGHGYHVGRDHLVPGAYSAVTYRDRSGLTNAASAIDVGKFGGSGFVGLRRFSVWLVGQCRDNAPGTRDIREVIYSPDGQKVMRWDRERGYDSAPRREGDGSHLFHTHISRYRDAQNRRLTPVWVDYFEPHQGTPEGPMKSIEGAVPDSQKLADVPKGTIVYDDSDEAAKGGPAGADDFVVNPGRLFRYLFKTGDVGVIAYDRDTSKPGQSLGFLHAGTYTLVDVP